MRPALPTVAILLAPWVDAFQASSQNPIGSGRSKPLKATYRGEDGLNEATAKYIEDTIAHFHTPSLSVAVLDGNETIFKSFGHAILGPTPVPATPDTLYYIASLTKSFTAAALLYTFSQTSASPPLTIKTKIASLLPADFVLPSAYATSHASIADALAHQLGLPPCDSSYGGMGFSVGDAVRSLRHLPQAAELREGFHYLNLGYMVLQHVIETLTGKWIGDVHREVSWGPLGMNSTVITLSGALALEADAGHPRLAHGYSYDRATNTSTRQPWTDTPLVGGGGIISSARDMAAWLRFFMDGHAPPALTDPLTLVGGPGRWPHMGPLLYAMGWIVSSYRGEPLVMHAGGLPGASTWMAYLPRRRWGAVLLANSDQSGEGAADAVFLRLMDDALGVPVAERYDPVPALDRRMDLAEQIWLHGRDLLFPPETVPHPPVPRGRPLAAYEGTYWDDGFRELELRVQEPRARTPVKNGTELVLGAVWRRLLNFTMELEWVSGEDFVVWVDTEVSCPELRGGLPARFRIGPDGEVESIGMVADPVLLLSGKMVWFQKMKNNGQNRGSMGEL